MSRTINRLSVSDSLLSANPETSVAIPLNSQKTFSSSVMLLTASTATLLVDSNYPFDENDRVIVNAGITNYPVLGSLSGERILTAAEYLPQRTNLVKNPSFEVNTTGWNLGTTHGTGGRTGTQAWRGSWSASLTPNVDYVEMRTFNNSTYRLPVNGYEYCRLTARVRNDTGVTCGYKLAFTWYEGSTLMFSDVQADTVTVSDSDGWVGLEYIELSPALADSCLVWVLADEDGGSFSAGDIIYVDAVMLEQLPGGDPSAVPPVTPFDDSIRPYFDGSTGYASWGGTSHLSESISTPVSLIKYNSGSIQSLYLGTEVTSSVSATVNPIYSHHWISSDNATVTTTSENFETTSRYVLEIEPTNSESITLTLSNVKLLRSDSLRRFQFNAKLYPNATVNVSTKLGMYDEYQSETAVVTSLYGGRYGAIRSNTLVMPDETDSSSNYYYDDYYYVTIEITISNHGGSTIYMTLPHLVDDQIYYDNWFVRNARLFMPDFYWDYDYQQENPIAPFHKLIDAMMVVSGETRSFYNESIPYENTELPSLQSQVEDPYRSTLVDPFYAKNDYLPWLSQFVGTKIKRNIVTSSGEKLLPSVALENEYAKWQVNTGYYGLNAGTRQAIMEAARQALIFTKDGFEPTGAVAVTNRYGGDVFTIRVQTLLNETMDVDVEGQSSAYVLDAIEPARPLGVKIVHTTASQFLFTLGDSTLGVLGSIGLG